MDLTDKKPLSSALWLDDDGMMSTQTPCENAVKARDVDESTHKKTAWVDGSEDPYLEGDESTIAPSRDSGASETPALDSVGTTEAPMVPVIAAAEPPKSESTEGELRGGELESEVQR